MTIPSDLTLPAGLTLPGMSLAYIGRLLRLETDFGLVVEFDGRRLARIQLPDIFHSKVEGICGNMNGNPNDDLTNNHMTTRHGQAWLVTDIEDPT